jgi:hypothetical protein
MCALLVGVYENGNYLPVIPPPILRSASSASRNLPRDPAMFVPPKAVARALHFSHSPKSAALRWLGLLGWGLEPHIRVLFSAIFQGVTLGDFHQGRNVWK